MKRLLTTAGLFVALAVADVAGLAPVSSAQAAPVIRGTVVQTPRRGVVQVRRGTYHRRHHHRGFRR